MKTILLLFFLSVSSLVYADSSKSYGFINKRGKTVIEPIYSEVNDFSEGLAEVKQESLGKWGFIDRTGKLVIPPKFDDTGKFSEGYAWVKIEQKYGYINKKGEIVIPPQFASASDFSSCRAKVTFIDETKRELIKDTPLDTTMIQSVGYINKEGKRIIDDLWMGYSFKNGVACVKNLNGLYGYIDTHGKYIIIPSFFRARNFSGGLAAVKKEKDGKYGYIDIKGNTVTPAKFDRAWGFGNDSLACVSIKEENFVINREGKRVFGLPKDAENVIPYKGFSEGLCAIGTDPQFGYQKLGTNQFNEQIPKNVNPELWEKIFVSATWGYVDPKGNFISPPLFQSAYSASDGFLRVKLNQKYGFIDKNGKWVIQPIYASCGDFHEGLAWFCK